MKRFEFIVISHNEEYKDEHDRFMTDYDCFNDFEDLVRFLLKKPKYQRIDYIKAYPSDCVELLYDDVEPF